MTGAPGRICTLGFVVSVFAASGLQGQVPDLPDSLPGAAPPTRLPSLGRPDEDRLRIRQVLGRESTDGFLIRSPSSRLPGLAADGRIRWSLIAPESDVVWNAELPFPLDEGAMWAGRGMSGQLMAGVRIESGRVALVLAPQLTYTQNLGFQTIPPDSIDRSAFAAPWYVGRHSADLPLRFGDRSFIRLHPGQSSLTVRAGKVAAGAATENQWWGPGIRNGIVMSSNAEGFPHLFLRTASPVRTPVGTLEGKWIVGGLTESLFFDTLSGNDYRSLSGFAATVRPSLAPNVTLGLSRVVYAAMAGRRNLPRHAFDVFTRWDHPQPPVRTVAPGDTTGRDTVFVWPEGPGREQLFSLFGRWVFPRDGVEVYGEWSRTMLPTSLLDFLNQPNHTQGYTLGLQWAKPVPRDHVVRLQAELTYLEESTTFNNRPLQGYYVSASVPQGYTHRGKVIGAAVGPGGSGQWLAGDYLARTWRAGAYLGRIRRNNDVYYDKPGRSYYAHDVSVYGGVRGGFRVWRLDADVQYGRELRYNYLFQNPEIEPWGHLAVDRRNQTLRMTLTPVR